MILIIISIVLAVILIFFVLPILVSELAYHKIFYHRGDGDIRIKYPSGYEELDKTPISFKNQKDIILRGFIYKHNKNKSPNGLIVMEHGIGGGHNYLLPLIRKFASDGYVILAFDQTGSGLSNGKCITSLTQAIYDLDSALTFAKEKDELNKLPIYLFGHSWGGFGVLNVLNMNKHDIKKIICVAGFDNDVSLFVGSNKAVKLLSWAIYLRNIFRYKKGAFYSASKAIKNNKSTKVLYIQGKNDKVVPPEVSGLKFKKINSPLLNVEMLDDKMHSPYIKGECEKEAMGLLSNLGLFGSKDLTHYGDNYDYEKLSEIDPKVYSLMLDFYNN